MVVSGERASTEPSEIASELAGAEVAGSALAPGAVDVADALEHEQTSGDQWTGYADGASAAALGGRAARARAPGLAVGLHLRDQYGGLGILAKRTFEKHGLLPTIMHGIVCNTWQWRCNCVRTHWRCPPGGDYANRCGALLPLVAVRRGRNFGKPPPVAIADGNDVGKQWGAARTRCAPIGWCAESEVTRLD
jgi:hypothetical protein